MAKNRRFRISTASVAFILAFLFHSNSGSQAAILASNGKTTNPDYFPIAVWLQSPSNAAAYKATGINLYIGLWNGPDKAGLDQLATASMPALCDQNAFALANLIAYKNVLAGWTQMDEPDNAQDNGAGGYNPCISPDTIIKRYTKMKLADSTRPVLLNLGQAVAYTGWYGRGTCTGKTDMYPQYLRGCDIACFDIYPVNSTDAPVKGNLWYVAKGVDSLRMWCGDRKPVWSWIECTSINGGTRPAPAQVKAEVWMALIHGAKGIGYFCHSFAPTFKEAAWLSDAEMKPAITAINQRIIALAPVLNSPTITGAVSVASGNKAVPVDIMVKNLAGAGYVFAVAMRGDTTTATFTVAGPAAKDTAEVLDENRAVPVVNGTFSDRFAGYGVHLYRIKHPGNGTIFLQQPPRRLGGQSDGMRLRRRGHTIIVSRDAYAYSMATAIKVCRLISCSGRQYATFSLSPGESVFFQTDKVPAGMYMVSISGDKLNGSKPFVVQ
jgi:hypothetical protein